MEVIMRRHKYLFSIYEGYVFGRSITVEYEHRNLTMKPLDLITYQSYIYYYNNINGKHPVYVGNIYRVTEINRTKEKGKIFYSIATRKLTRCVGAKYVFEMIILNEKGFEYYKSLAVENRI
jgi:hypothetical protein